MDISQEKKSQIIDMLVYRYDQEDKLKQLKIDVMAKQALIDNISNHDIASKFDRVAKDINLIEAEYIRSQK